MLSCLKLHFIMSHWSLQCPGKFKSSMVISVLSLLFPLTFGFKISLWVQSLHLRKSGCRNTGNFGMQNHESTACNPKSKTVLHILTLGRVQPSCWSCRLSRSSSWTQIMHAMSKLRRRKLSGPPRLSLFSMLWLHYFQRVYNLQSNN